MTLTAQRVTQAIWQGVDPYEGFPAGSYSTDITGWNSGHSWLVEAMDTLRPKIVVEVGVWKGASTLMMAHAMRERQIDGCVIAIDTWLGSWDHWLVPEAFQGLIMEGGRPQLMRTFMQNVVSVGLSDYVVPLPLDSSNAWHVLAHRGIVPDVVHIDASHDRESVLADLNRWWQVLRPGGLLIGDDYYVDGHWHEVREAFDQFFPWSFEHQGGKCRVTKTI